MELRRQSSENDSAPGWHGAVCCLPDQQIDVFPVEAARPGAVISHLALAVPVPIQHFSADRHPRLWRVSRFELGCRAIAHALAPGIPRPNPRLETPPVGLRRLRQSQYRGPIHDRAHAPLKRAGQRTVTKLGVELPQLAILCRCPGAAHGGVTAPLPDRPAARSATCPHHRPQA